MMLFQDERTRMLAKDAAAHGSDAHDVAQVRRAF
jgi:hypothetical protein